MKKHTPGPWFATQPEHASGWWVVSKDKEGFDCVDDSADGGFFEGNARLIAAAPDLLDALKEIVKNDPYNQSSAGIIARAAIAKAIGGAE